MSVVLAGGGTAGHIEPALALADALRRADPELGIVCLGTERGLETRLVPMRGYELALIPPVPLPRKVTPELMGVPGRLNASVAAAGRVLDQARAQVLVGFGGYVATPAYLAARRRHVPIMVHEANARPGLANRIGARFTRFVFTGQPDTKLPHANYVGIPLRREIAGLDRLALADKARAHFGLRPDLPVLLVTGGSQGARSLNYAVLDAAEAIRAAGIQVLHILGPRSDIQVQMPPGGPPYVTLPYLDRMDLAYAAADFAICRSGAMTCAELTAVGLPAVYVPLPHGNGEQRLNALPVAAAGGGLIVADAELTPDWIRADLLPILTDAQLVAAMSQAAAGIGHRDTDVRMAAEVLGLIRGGPAGPGGMGGPDPAEPGRRPGQGRGQRGGRRRSSGDGRRPPGDGRGPYDDAHRQPGDGRGRPGGGQAPPGRYDDPGWPGGGGYEQPGQYGDPRPAGPAHEEPGWYADPRPAGPGYEEPGWYEDPRPAGPGYDQAGPYPDPRRPGR
jgi:UDP-N-acetylglucosamine--N-acetylmuramyl-(pentapeptide) pyrophosphoryl-undecaprenol N-acetylglucosamine transferase